MNLGYQLNSGKESLLDIEVLNLDKYLIAFLIGNPKASMFHSKPGIARGGLFNVLFSCLRFTV